MSKPTPKNKELIEELSKIPSQKMLKEAQDARAAAQNGISRIMREESRSFEGARRVYHDRVDQQRRAYFEWLCKQEPYTRYCLDMNYRPHKWSKEDER